MKKNPASLVLFQTKHDLPYYVVSIWICVKNGMQKCNTFPETISIPWTKGGASFWFLSFLTSMIPSIKCSKDDVELLAVARRPFNKNHSGTAWPDHGVDRPSTNLRCAGTQFAVSRVKRYHPFSSLVLPTWYNTLRQNDADDGSCHLECIRMWWQYYLRASWEDRKLPCVTAGVISPHDFRVWKAQQPVRNVY